MLQLAAGLVVAVYVVPSRADAARHAPRSTSVVEPVAISHIPVKDFYAPIYIKYGNISGPISVKGADCRNLVVEAYNAAGTVVSSARAVADTAGCRYALRVPANETLSLGVRNM